MDRVQTVINLIIAICSLVPTLVSLFCLIKNIIKEKDWKCVQKVAMEAMASVEEYSKEHPEMTSDDKLNMALKAVEAGLGAADIKLDASLIKKIADYIEEMCSWSKKVNNNK